MKKSSDNSLLGQRDLTRGNMLKNLLIFSFPFLLANLLQAIYGAVDLWVVGKFGGGKAGVAAVATGGEVMHLVMSFIMGITAAATVLIGQYYGANDRKNTGKCVGMSLLFSLITGIAGTVLMVLLSPWMVAILNTPAEAEVQALQYLAICSTGVVFVVVFNAFAAIFRGYGNSAIPLICIAIACVFNIVLDIILVRNFGMGVRGAAYATIASQALSVIVSFIFFLKGDFDFKFNKSNFTLVWHLVGKYVRIGIPIGIQNTLISLSFLFIVSIVNKMGGDNPACSAGYGIVNRLNGFAMLPAISFAMAMSALTAQNIGAKKYVRAIKTLNTALAFTMTLGAVFLICMQLAPGVFIGLFLDSTDPGTAEVIAQGTLYARSFSIEYILVPIIFCSNGFFIGSGHSMFSMINNLIPTVLLRIPISYFVSLMSGATLFHIGLAAPAASGCSAVISIIFLLSGKWKNVPEKSIKKLSDEKMT